MNDVKRHLFFTGDIGCGKSTAIASALGDKLYCCGGFRTCRHNDGALRFSLDSTDGKESFVFLDFSGTDACLDISVFSRAASMLCGRALVLDEIGGVELASAEFSDALFKVLDSDVPVIGVLKSPEALKTMADRLCLPEDFICMAHRLNEKLAMDDNTTLYRCGKYDKNALALAQSWVRKYLND